MNRRYVLIGLMIGFLAIGGTSWAKGFFKVGEIAPLFSLTSVAGQQVSLNDLKGKVVVLGLFHICEPCLIQSTNLQKVHEATQGKNVAVVGVNSSGDSKADILEFMGMFPLKVTYPYLIDPDQVTDRLYGGGRFIPNVYILDQQGVIRWQRVGNMDLADHKIILDEVNKLLGPVPSTSSGSL
ncbi:TlpA disulfide reductase family protein [Candidatus Nitronereus thalassa]|uniref:TlpA disulfide reductase family protein n=1 Tax=Candidatus Nitronereus thalassa TaxID=3020898 RepID=A0ABU3K433_9BACT|nr:TlpA disulfide reductase family protein [Candidatus Nitronereus thalassa]MDT7041149.1 TlpA disulfide reductase family protein [Candidatus Nitronereus thalassa]